MSTREPTGPRPSLRPTSIATLAVAGLAAAALAWLSISHWYWDIPRLPWLPAVTLLALAAFEALLAQQTRARIERRPGRPPVEPLAVARSVVLAKASSLAGAIFLGFTAAITAWLLLQAQRNQAAAADMPTAVLSVIASFALVAAALWLERACRVPERPDQNERDAA